ncbi:hypothetical protein [Glaciihabitans sp. UYNi722]|uniref:hypothetical protein n=1 Tax=Glaciihabitans sp. UYNi722 TaxID=3156344 RepID=UPI00339B1313
MFAAGPEVLPTTCDIELNTAVNATAEVTPGNVIARVDTSRFPVPTSTAAVTWSLIGNVKCVALGRAPVTPTVVGPGGNAALADCATPPTNATATTAVTSTRSLDARPFLTENFDQRATTSSTQTEQDHPKPAHRQINTRRSGASRRRRGPNCLKRLRR